MNPINNNNAKKVINNSVKERIEQIKMEEFIKKIRSDFLYLNAMEQSKKYDKVPTILEELSPVFKEDFSKKLFDVAKNNHPNSKEILYVGALYHTFAGNIEEAVKYYVELAEQNKLIGKKEDYEKYYNIVKKLTEK